MIRWKKPSAEILWLAALLLLAAAYYWVFEISIIVPQTGWWHYMSWRMLEGDLPYRDFYLFLPPYYVFLTTGLYAIFGSHMFSYTVFGFFMTRVLAWCMFYRILIRKINPSFAFLSIFTGLCLTSSYLMDQVYDYNPTVFMLVFALALLILKFCEAETSRREYAFVCLAGVVSGLLLMIKQTVGLFFPVFCPVIIALVCRLKEERALKKIGAYFAAAFAAALPGVIYILANGLTQDFFYCLSVATQAKTGQGSLLLIAIRNFIYPKELALALFLAANICWFRTYRQAFQNRYPGKRVHLADAALAGGATLLTLFCSFPSIHAVLNTISLITHTEYAVLVIGWLCAAAALFFADYRIWKKRGTPSRKLRIAMALLAIATLFSAIFAPLNFQQFFDTGINFRFMIRMIMTVMMYLDLMLLAYMIWLIVAKKRRDLMPLAIALLILLSFYCMAFLSSSHEELYALTSVGIFLAFFLEYARLPSSVRYWKNALICVFCTVICMVCLMQKIMVPYEWHGWQMSKLYDSTNPMSQTEEEALKEFRLPAYDARTYDSICSIVKKYSDPNDVVFQFPNIPLFNVIAERKTIFYAIPYFDVMPDSLAEETADYLWENAPQMLVWANLTEGRWRAHENAFRGGAFSGQRAIQRWHDAYASNHYRRVDIFPNINGSGDCIEVWTKCAFAGGVATERIAVTPEQHVAEQYGAFSQNSFQKCVLMIPEDVSVPEGQTVRIDLYGQAGALADSIRGELTREDREYWSVTADHDIRVTPGETYRIHLDFQNVRYGFQIGVSAPGTASEERYCLCYGEPAPRSFNLSLFCE